MYQHRLPIFLNSNLVKTAPKLRVYSINKMFRFLLQFCLFYTLYQYIYIYIFI